MTNGDRAQPHRPIRVVVVDDHEMVAESLRRTLTSEGDIEVAAVAGTARDGVEQALATAPDVVVMDYLLPDGDGITAAAELRAARPEINVVVITGNGAEGALLAALSAGCVGYVEKTSGVEKLREAVRAAARGEVAVLGGAAGLAPRAPGGSGGRGSLTAREREVLGLLAVGMSNRAIAQHLVLSTHTVRTHVQSVLGKLGAHCKLEAVAIARRKGLLAA